MTRGETKMVKCRRTACTNEVDAVLGGGIHKHTGDRYCIPCARKINAAAGETVIEFPKFNTRDPNLQQIPRKP